ncbi:MAG: hypothetical protein M1375_01420 [Candidatus Thermoplasmatota archaeon]|jgi:hypothetical protein|nr:hypothetical protein [Candidatus Thermoplasmatota archaeon]MCL5790617.1 hypothetical protein [Candidatus Thermoplasmatota archaeon]
MKAVLTREKIDEEQVRLDLAWELYFLKKDGAWIPKDIPGYSRRKE